MSYIMEQEILYGEVEDPWGNRDKNHPRYNLYQQYFRLAIGMILPRYKTIMDMGCGIGGLVDLINRTTDKIAIGVDTSPSAIKTARRFYPKWHYEVGNAKTWRPKEPVDMVIFTGFYHHIEKKNDRLNTLKHARSYINDGGGLIIFYNGTNYLSGKKHIQCQLDIASELFSVFAPQQIITFKMIDYTTPKKIQGLKWEEGSWIFYTGEKRPNSMMKLTEK